MRMISDEDVEVILQWAVYEEGKRYYHRRLPFDHYGFDSYYEALEDFLKGCYVLAKKERKS